MADLKAGIDSIRQIFGEETFKDKGQRQKKHDFQK